MKTAAKTIKRDHRLGSIEYSTYEGVGRVKTDGPFWVERRAGIERFTREEARADGEWMAAAILFENGVFNSKTEAA